MLIEASIATLRPAEMLNRKVTSGHSFSQNIGTIKHKW